MKLVIFIGIQATGKSSFYKDRFYRTHVRVNYDMLNTRHRENLIFKACIDGMELSMKDASESFILGRLQANPR